MRVCYRQTKTVVAYQVLLSCKTCFWHRGIVVAVYQNLFRKATLAGNFAMLHFDCFSLARIVECRSLDKQERGVLLVFEHFHGASSNVVLSYYFVG